MFKYRVRQLEEKVFDVQFRRGFWDGLFKLDADDKYIYQFYMCDWFWHHQNFHGTLSSALRCKEYLEQQEIDKENNKRKYPIIYR